MNSDELKQFFNQCKKLYEKHHKKKFTIAKFSRITGFSSQAILAYFSEYREVSERMHIISMLIRFLSDANKIKFFDEVLKK